MKERSAVKLRDARVTSVEVGEKWTIIKIKVRTDSIAAQGARRILGKTEGSPVQRKIREKSRKYVESLTK